MSETNPNLAANCVKGYKIFNPNWKCLDKQYTCPGVFEEDIKPEICKHGMHFCYELRDCFTYCPYADETYHWAEIIAFGDIADSYPKACTNKLAIIREIPYEEVVCEYDKRRDQNQGWFNDGHGNVGTLNSGNYNTGCNNFGNDNTNDCNCGCRNSGFFNVGDCNSGNYNIGSSNVGSYNVGGWNSGSFNYGNNNSGDFNIGYHNSGDFNNTKGSCGAFNTEYDLKIMMFNKPSNWTFEIWRCSSAYLILRKIMETGPVKVISASNMTDEQKAKHPEYKFTYSYLENKYQSKKIQKNWDELSWSDKKRVMELPNFDPDIFYQCTGIDVGADWGKFKAGYDEKQE